MRAMEPVAILLLAGASPSVCAKDLSTYSGIDLFTRYCASCHGLHGEGDGPVATYFKLQPPDLSHIARRHGGEFPDEEVRKIIDGRADFAAHGTRTMPVWGLEFAAAEDGRDDAESGTQSLISRLLKHLRSIQRD